MLDKLFANLLPRTTKKETVYRGTANPNATNSELDAKKVISYTDQDGTIDVHTDCFVSLIESRGYVYDDGNDWYERIWSTNEGSETIREVYQQLENGTWKQLMIGYGENVFYEETVDGHK